MHQYTSMNLIQFQREIWLKIHVPSSDACLVFVMPQSVCPRQKYALFQKSPPIQKQLHLSALSDLDVLNLQSWNWCLILASDVDKFSISLSCIA